MSETFKSKVVIVNFHGSVILPYRIKAKRCMSIMLWFGLMFDKGQKQSSTLSCDSSYKLMVCCMNECKTVMPMLFPGRRVHCRVV